MSANDFIEAWVVNGTTARDECDDIAAELDIGDGVVKISGDGLVLRVPIYVVLQMLRNAGRFRFQIVGLT